MINLTSFLLLTLLSFTLQIEHCMKALYMCQSQVTQYQNANIPKTAIPNCVSYDKNKCDMCKKGFALSTATQYSQSVDAVEQFLSENNIDSTLDDSTPDEVQHIIDMLMGRQDFVAWNSQRHHQYSAALAQYIDFLRHDRSSTDSPNNPGQMTIKDVVSKYI